MRASRSIIRSLVMGALVVIAACQTTPNADLEDLLFNADQVGVRWGLVVADMDGMSWSH